MCWLQKNITVILAILCMNLSYAQTPTGKDLQANEKNGSIKEAINLIETKKENEGIEILNYLIRNSKDSLSYLYYLKAMAYYKLENYEQSMDLCEKSILQNSLYYKSYALKADIFQKTQQYDSALACYTLAEKGLLNEPSLLNNMGTLYLKTGRLYAAKATFQRADSIEQNNSDFLYNLSFVHYKLGEYEQALAVIEKAILLRKEDAGLYNLKGQILGKAGRIDEAIRSFEKSVQLKPFENNATENLRRIKAYYSK